MNGLIMNDNDIFHVHTSRCGHAEHIPDEEYVKTALELGKSGIWFTDHAPFPDDPFRGRMKCEELEEYLTSLTELKEKYHGFVHIGLEIEYFPSFDKAGYYKQLSADQRIECMLLGQHMAEDPNKSGHYTFEWEKERLCVEEYQALGAAICQGIHRGYFCGIAHPDRIFRRCKTWTREMETISRQIIDGATQMNIPLERNMHSLAVKNYNWPEFWGLLPLASHILIGLDAHSKQELLRRNQRAEKRYLI